MLGTTGLLMLDSRLPGALTKHVLYVQEVQDYLITHARNTQPYMQRYTLPILHARQLTPAAEL